ncbi:hypothetical protein [Vibrio sp. 10N.239.312.D08]|uniref:hypothetical protein n=1 Tax=Vibrio sp. 10N.239.312.D08 TaxID=3229978 RepID=UPI00354C7170
MTNDEMTQEELELYNDRLKLYQLDKSVWVKSDLPRTLIFGIVFVTFICYLSSSVLHAEMPYSWYVLGPWIGTILSLPVLGTSFPKKPTKDSAKFDVAVMKLQKRKAFGSND